MNSKQILILNNFYVGTKIIKFQTYAYMFYNLKDIIYNFKDELENLKDQKHFFL